MRTLIMVICFLVSGCLYQEPIRIETPVESQLGLPPIKTDSPRYAPLYSNRYVLEIRNGLAYFVEISIGPDEKIYLHPGGQAYIPFIKSHYRRRIPISGLVLQVVNDTTAEIKGLKGKKQLKRIVGTIAADITIPSRIRRNQEEATGLWRIRSFTRLRE